MAKATLATNFKDDILASSMNGKRRYKQTTNSDGTVSLEDASTYTQVGSAYGASQVNAQNAAINESADGGKIIDTMSAIQVNTQSNYIAGAKAVKEVIDSLVSNIYVGSDGKLHKVQGGADTVLPFSSPSIKFLYANFCSSSVIELVFDISNVKKITAITRNGANGTATGIKFYGAKTNGISEYTATTTDGEAVTVNNINTSSFTLLSSDGTTGYQYTKHILDVSEYNYFYIERVNLASRSWIHLFECE